MSDAIPKKQLGMFKLRLLELKQDLESATQLTEQDRAPVELDQQSVGRLSRMNAMQVQAMSQAHQRQREIDLRRVVGAISRLEDGDYGFCTECDEVIAIKRLEIDPAAGTCIDCASKQESR